jgi:hypothetical protein
MPPDPLQLALSSGGALLAPNHNVFLAKIRKEQPHTTSPDHATSQTRLISAVNLPNASNTP